MNWPCPLVWMICFYGLLTSRKKKETYRLDETLRDEIIRGGNTLMIMQEKRA